MAVRKNQPVQGAYAAMLAFAVVFAAPVLAAPDRSICDESTGPTLEITTTEFSTAADADESIELLLGARDQPATATISCSTSADVVSPAMSPIWDSASVLMPAM